MNASRDAPALNTGSYAGLVRQSVPKEKPLYRLDDPGLFEAIATQRIAPGPGPDLAAKVGAADAR